MNKNYTMSLTLCSVLGVFMVSGSAATMSYAATQTLPSCTDPTGQNLRCMMVISTLPPPPNALQCQETSGQLLPCSYTTQNLSNGELIVAITVYVPANYVFSGYGPWTAVKQVVHETTTKTRTLREPCPDGQILNHTSHKCIDVKPPPPRTCERADSSAITDPDKNLKTKDCDIHDANEHGMTPTPPPSTCKDNTTCPKVNTTSSAISKPSGGGAPGSTCVNNCTSGTAPPVDCTKNPTDPSCTQSLTPSTTTPPLTSVPPSTPPTTKTCPDGSVIDASANCPTQSTPPTNPNTPSTPPSTSGTPPPSNNPSPPSSGNNGGGGSSSGSGSGGGSGASQPTTVN